MRLTAVANSTHPALTSQRDTPQLLKTKQSSADLHGSFHDQRAKTPLSRRELSYGEVA